MEPETLYKALSYAFSGVALFTGVAFVIYSAKYDGTPIIEEELIKPSKLEKTVEKV